jgi:hypothetical protein
MTQPTAWSFSRLSSYENCPKKYYHESVAKTYPFEKNEASMYGDEVHKAFELYFRRGQTLPFHLKHLDRYLAPINAAPGEKVVEQQLCFNAQWEQVEWYSKDAYFRTKQDLLIINGKSAVAFDWKTGKMKDDFTQLDLNAAVTMHIDQNIEQVTSAFFWIQSKTIAPKTVTRAQIPDVWGAVMPRVERYQQAHAAQDFPPRQGFLCKGYCPVKTCQFWEPKRK